MGRSRTKTIVHCDPITIYTPGSAASGSKILQIDTSGAAGTVDVKSNGTLIGGVDSNSGNDIGFDMSQTLTIHFRSSATPPGGTVEVTWQYA